MLLVSFKKSAKKKAVEKFLGNRASSLSFSIRFLNPVDLSNATYTDLTTYILLFYQLIDWRKRDCDRQLFIFSFSIVLLEH